jgi:hypothetical protein
LRFRDISTADSAVRPLHANRFDGQQQAVVGNGGAMAFARGDEDPFAGRGC